MTPPLDPRAFLSTRELAATAVPGATAKQLVSLLGLLDSPYTEQAVAMSVEEIADLLAALAERDLRWIPGTDGECGTLLEGQPEPPDLHVVFDAFRGAWQRDDADGDPRRWFSATRATRSRCTWDELQRDVGPLTPEAGIAPTTPQDGES